MAAGNSGDRMLTPSLAPLLLDPEPLVRGHSAWALGKLGGADATLALKAARRSETDEFVLDEIEQALLAPRG